MLLNKGLESKGSADRLGDEVSARAATGCLTTRGRCQRGGEPRRAARSCSVCKEVDSFDHGLVSLVADLEETVASPGRAGLAANQIGVVRRVFSWQIDGEVGHLVNPVIEAEESEQDDDGEEGCLSIPGLFTRVHGRSL